MTRRRHALLALILALVATSCGDDGDAVPVESGGTDTADNTDNTDTPDTPDTPDIEEAVDDLADDLSETQASQGGGSATLTVGDQTWTFESVLCAFGEEMIGQEGAVFNLSSIQDGMQMYASVDDFGHSVSLEDIEDFDDPAVSLSSAFGAGDFIELDGKNVSAEIGFLDQTSDDPTEIPGTFTATCP